MLGDGALAAPGADGVDAGGSALLVGAVRLGRELDEGVEWDLRGWVSKMMRCLRGTKHGQGQRRGEMEELGLTAIHGDSDCDFSLK